MKKVFLLLMMIFLSGCGWFQKQASSVTGSGYETCNDGVLYLQFTSGVTVKYTREGKIATCR